MANQTLSVVIPVFNEGKNLPELWSRICAVLSKLDIGAEVIFIDDGSSDQSAAILKDFCEKDPRAKLIRLSRNFGHQPALTAGLDHAKGDAVVLMDGDLQDKPEAIAEFVRRWHDGNDVVYAVRTSRQENAVMRMAFKSFYRMMARMSGIHLPSDAGIFGLLDRRVVDILKSMPERNRYFPGLRAYTGFRQVGVEVDRDARFSGKSHVGILGLLHLALDGLISFSYLPIRIATLIGFVVASGSFCYLMIVAYHKLFTHKAIAGWASTLGAVLFIGGIQLIMLGVVGEYVGRIYEETKKRPYYIVSETRNLTAS